MPNPIFPYCTSCPWYNQYPPIHIDPPTTITPGRKVMVVGEGPGQDEIRQGLPFVGRTGHELNNQYLPLANLGRGDVYCSNATRCAFAHGTRNPNHKEGRTCARHHLIHELLEYEPDLVITLGAVAASMWDQPIPLSRDHGRLMEVSLTSGALSWYGLTIPTYHPAAGMRSPKFITPIRSDFRRVRAVLEEGYINPEDQYPNPDYQELTNLDLQQFRSIIRDGHQYTVQTGSVGPCVDTETDMSHPHDKKVWCMSLAFRPGTGYMIQVTQRALWDEFQSYIRSTRPTMLYHNFPHDYNELTAAGLHVPDRKYICTLQRAYLLNLPEIGLKPLAWKLCGMKMDDYQEVVYPGSAPIAISYLNLFLTNYASAFSCLHTLKSGPRKGTVEVRWPKSTPGKPVYNKVLKAVRLLETFGVLCGGKVEDELEVEGEEDAEGEELGNKLLHEPDTETEGEEETGASPGAGPGKDGKAVSGGPIDPWKRWNTQWYPEDRQFIQEVSGEPTGLPQPSIVYAYAHNPTGTIRYACRDVDAPLRFEPILRQMMGRRFREQMWD